MPRRLASALTLTDWLFLAYWATAALARAHLLTLPPTWMYAGYGEPRTDAWNWSFLPLDLAFSATGLAALHAARKNRPIWRPLALISLTLTITAGLMAVAYWTLLGEFDPAWFLPNAALIIWPLFFLPNLVRSLAAPIDTPPAQPDLCLTRGEPDRRAESSRKR